MTGMEIYEDARTVSRADLAAWLRQLASQLESGGQLFYGAAGAVRVADQVECELEIEREDGEISVEIEFSWTDPVAPAAEGTSSAAGIAEDEQIEVEETGEAAEAEETAAAGEAGEADKAPETALAGHGADDSGTAQPASGADDAAAPDAEPSGADDAAASDTEPSGADDAAASDAEPGAKA